MAEFFIDQRAVGGMHPALIIAEVAQAHDGSLNVAHAFIDSAAEAGADAIKFQTHIAAAESSAAEQWRVQFSRQDATRYDYWKRMEFTPEQWRGLKEHADAKGLIFLSSPFSLEAIDILENIGMGAWKIASGEVRNEVLLSRILRTRQPILLSSGMSTWDDLASSVERFKDAGVPFLVMQCTSSYPCPPEKIGLNLIHDIQDRFGCDSGLSDHSGTIWPSLAAVTLGAKAIELHVTWDRSMFGPDTIASVTFKELRQLVDGIRYTEKMLASPVDKDKDAAGMERMKTTFGQSLTMREALVKGTTLNLEHFATRKPLVGISAADVHQVVGKRLTRDVAAGEFLHHSDLEK